jgi:hypothetical protein
MIDQGFCFNAGEWNYPDAPLRGLYTRNRVYEGITGMESFGPWIARIQTITERVLEGYAHEVPPEWYEDDQDALWKVLEHLYRRRSRVRSCSWWPRTATGSRFPIGDEPSSEKTVNRRDGVGL